MDRAILSVDGNAGCALLGENLQDGEAEFVVVAARHGEPRHEAEVRACWAAFKALKARLNRPDISYAWYPRRPGSAGA
jgi:ribonuclease HI